MPTPNAGEARDDFMERCMGDAEAVGDYPDAEQRFAVCTSLWEQDKMTETKAMAVPFECKAMDDAGHFEGYASVFDVVDLGFDVVKRGAFRKSLESGRKVKMLWQHDMWQPIGVWDSITEDERGLYVKGRVLMDVQAGREAHALMKAGALDSMSIGYRVTEASDEGRIRNLDAVELMEISLVTFPMNEHAMVTDVKSIKTIRDFERALRDAGFSQREAKAIAADGFNGLAAHRDDVAPNEPKTEGLQPLMDSLRQLQETLSNA